MKPRRRESIPSNARPAGGPNVTAPRDPAVKSESEYSPGTNQQLLYICSCDEIQFAHLWEVRTLDRLKRQGEQVVKGEGGGSTEGEREGDREGQREDAGWIWPKCPRIDPRDVMRTHGSRAGRHARPGPTHLTSWRVLSDGRLSVWQATCQPVPLKDSSDRWRA